LNLLAQESSWPAGSLVERFKQLDRNGDGKLSATEFPIAQSQQMDKSDDGKLHRNALSALLFDRFDADKDGFLSEEELKALWRTQP